jgi:splicing factor 3B subunit 1
LIETTVEIAGKVGGAEIVKKIVDELKDDNESYRKIVIETIEKVVA